VEHVFGTFKHWMGYAHFLMRRLPNVGTENERACLQSHACAQNPGVQEDDESDATGGGVSTIGIRNTPKTVC
jgi:hypothetical protein